MREQLIQYVNLLFAGNSGVEDIREEILQNTLDRYDDLISQGKSPESAYRLAIAGIGDINEILGRETPEPDDPVYTDWTAPDYGQEMPSALPRIMRAAAIGLYIISPIPLIALDSIGLDILGLCGTLGIIAVATILMIIFKKGQDAEQTFRTGRRYPEEESPQQELRSGIRKLVGLIGLIVYLILSFATGAWHITWLVFPLMASVQGLIRAVFDLVEDKNYER